MICEVRSDCQFFDLWLVGFWYGGWILSGVVVGFVGYRWVWLWVSGEVSWVANGCGCGSQVHLEWVTEASQWLRFCGFFCHWWWWLAVASYKLLGLVAIH